MSSTINKYKAFICKAGTKANVLKKRKKRVQDRYTEWLPDYELVSGSEEVEEVDGKCYYKFNFTSTVELSEYLEAMNNGRGPKVNKNKKDNPEQIVESDEVNDSKEKTKDNKKE